MLANTAHNYKIVHVANIEFLPEFFFDEMVEWVQINIGEKLTGQITNRHPLASAFIACPDEAIQQAQQFAIPELPSQQALQDGMIHTGKILVNVTQQHIACATYTSHECMVAPHGG